MLWLAKLIIEFTGEITMKKSRIIGTLSAVVFSFISVSANASLTNGTFEAGDATGGDFGGAAGWTTFEDVFTSAWDGPGWAPVSHDTTPGTPTQSLKMFGPFRPGDAAGAFQDVAVTAGQEYELSAWVMNWIGDPFENLGILLLLFIDGDENELGEVIGQTVDPFGTADVDLSVIQDGAEVSDWTRLAVSGVAPAGTVSARAFLLHIQTGDPCCAGGALYWDDVQLNEVPVPAAVWLFGSGLIGLIGIARRKKVA